MNNLSYSRKFSNFYIETSALVDQYFLKNQISKTGDLSLIFKAFSFFIVGLMVFIANLIISKSVINVLIFTLLAGLCIGILTTFTHESTHMVFAKEKWKNRLMTHFIDLMGACSLGYQINHSKHHNFTNIEGADTDIHFEPFIRLTSQQKRHWWHGFQHIYTPFLYSLSRLFLIWDIRGYALFKDKNMNSKLFFWLSKIFHIGVFLIIPILSLGFNLGLVTYFGIMLTSGLFLCLLNEPIHLFDGANFTKPNLLTNKIEQTWDQVVLS